MRHRSSLASLDDQALLQSLKTVAARANQITAVLLQHLAEVDARGAYRLWSAPTLQAYCTYELRLSEDEAQRRCRAARLARQFPRLLDMLADSSLHLTGLLLVGPHLTPDNESELLGRVAFRTKREIERILAEVAPRPDAASLVQPLGPAGDGIPSRAPGGWTALVRGIAGFERSLPPGVGPGDAPSVPSNEPDEAEATDDAPPSEPGAAPESAHLPDERADVSVPLRYRVQFTADQQFVDLLAEARDLLWHRLPDGDLASVQRLALEALVAQLRRTKYAALHPRRNEEGAAPARPGEAAMSRDRSADADTPAAVAAPARFPEHTDAAPATPVRSDSHEDTRAAPARFPESDASTPDTDAPAPSRQPSPPPRSAPRPHLPVALRRDVWQRDGGRCTFVDSRGVRCPSTAALEFHHLQAHALGGPTTPGNLTLRCHSHNRFAAEIDFGAELVGRCLARDRVPGSSPSRPL